MLKAEEKKEQEEVTPPPRVGKGRRVSSGGNKSVGDRTRRQRQGSTPGTYKTFGQGRQRICIRQEGHQQQQIWNVVPGVDQGHGFSVEEYLKSVEKFADDALLLGGDCVNSSPGKTLASSLDDRVSLDGAMAKISLDDEGVNTSPSPGRVKKSVKVSLRLEHCGLTDADMHCLCNRLKMMKHKVKVKKLWLFDNKIGDVGATTIAECLSDFDLNELHLSHNVVTTDGALSILRHLAYMATDVGARRPLWLRMEWNRISVDTIMEELQILYQEQGFLVDIPTCPLQSQSSLKLPPYLASSIGKSPSKSSKKTSQDSRRRGRLEFLLESCHCRLPWIQSQYQKPSESTVLKVAKQSWISHESSPLLIIPDTSCLLSLIDAPLQFCRKTFFTFDFLLQLCEDQLFGSKVPLGERIHFIVPSSVAIQLDSLKCTSPALRKTISRFMGALLDEAGPSSHNFISMLGSHEAEGIIMDNYAESTESNSRMDIGSSGQAADHRIVETALYFQHQCLVARASSCGSSFSFSPDTIKNTLPVIFFTSDVGQERLARRNGVPVLAISSLDSLHRQITDRIQGREQLTASFLRTILRPSSSRDLGWCRLRSLQTSFDAAIVCLEALLQEQKTKASTKGPFDQNLVSDIEKRLVEWKAMVRTKLDLPSILSWM